MALQIGWVDFSDKDRKRAIDVLHLLNDGAMDELGIGVVRDAFANYFFPGTSTIQTRAKYFLIVPYALRMACSKYPDKPLHQVLAELDRLEKQSAQNMKVNDEQEGIIGASVLPKKWVVRKPSSVYWNGIRTLGILKVDNMSMVEAVGTLMGEFSQKRQRSSGRMRGDESIEGAEDDLNAIGSGKSIWDSWLEYNEDWLYGLTIDLTKREAAYLRYKISNSEAAKKSLFKFLLDKNISVDGLINGSAKTPFEALADAINKSVSDEMATMLHIANLFNILVYSLHVRYNLQMGNEEAVDLWKGVPPMVDSLKELDLNDMFTRLKITGTFDNFLINSQELLLAGKYDELDDCILNRELALKGEKRCKLNDKDRHNETWIGGKWLDYRLMNASRILKDIYDAEKGGDNA
ncbi:MAG: hypothetical protein IKP62_02870 [Salinivirgaceae bacterium]|nr:hypothetical protein [Salinivirgaceae bacterium]